MLFTKLRAFSIAGLAALALAACGGASTATTAPTTAAQPTSAATSAPTSAAAETTIAPTSAAATDATSAPTSAEAQTPAATTTTASFAKLNLNDVSEDQLLSTIPNFSNRMVREFFEYRPYVSIQQFRKEIGKYVDANQVAEYEQYVYVPVSVNESDAATLQQLPGVDESIANQLIAARPYSDTQAFLTKLATLVSADQASQAAPYLAAQ